MFRGRLGVLALGLDLAAVRQAITGAAFPQGGTDGFRGDTDGSPEPLLNMQGL